VQSGRGWNLLLLKLEESEESSKLGKEFPKPAEESPKQLPDVSPKLPDEPRGAAPIPREFVDMPRIPRLPHLRKELYVFRFDNSLRSLDTELTFRGRHDSTHRILISFLWTSGGLRRRDLVRFFFQDAVLTVTEELYTTLREQSSQTAPTEKRILSLIRKAYDATRNRSWDDTSKECTVPGVYVWLHEERWRRRETSPQETFEYFIRKGSDKSPPLVLLLDPAGVHLRPFSKTPLVWSRTSCPNRCIIIVGGPKGIIPFSSDEVIEIVNRIPNTVCKTIAFGHTIEFTSVLAGHVQMLSDMNIFLPAVLDLVACPSKEAYNDLNAHIETQMGAIAATQTQLWLREKPWDDVNEDGKNNAYLSAR